MIKTILKTMAGPRSAAINGHIKADIVTVHCQRLLKLAILASKYLITDCHYARELTGSMVTWWVHSQLTFPVA